MTINAGYIGYAEINGTQIRCTDFSVVPSQDALFYNHIYGLRDGGSNGGKGDTGALNTQRTLFRPSVISISGGISFPATEGGGASVLFDLAKTGDSFDMDFHYDCDNGRSFNSCKVGRFEFSIVAGDIINISADIMANNVADGSGASEFNSLEKLITWDKVSVGDFGDGVQAFNFSINNNLIPIYTAGGNSEYTNKLLPAEIRVGMQEVTGTITAYGMNSHYYDISNKSTITVSAPGFSTNINCVFRPSGANGSSGAIVNTYPFIGVDRAFE